MKKYAADQKVRDETEDSMEQQDTIYIFGHRNPDADSICAAIAYAELKRKLGYQAEARRLGEMNEETAFILNYFKVPVPQMLDNVKTQVRDLNIDMVDRLSPDISIKTAWSIMDKTKIKTLPVVDDNQKLLGLVSITNITAKYMDAFDYSSIATCGTKIDNILETLAGDIVAGRRKDFQSTGKVVVAACMPEGYGDYMEAGDIVIVGNREDAQKRALELGANCIIITCGFEPSAEMRALAESMHALIIRTAFDTYTTVRLINQSLPVGSIMTADVDGGIAKFHIDDFVEDIRDKMIKNRYRSYPVIDAQGVVLGSVSRYHLITHRKKKVILLDHNEKMQTVTGIEEAEIIEIIDHHKVGDLTTSRPILFKNEPVGSTSTIIANLYSEKGRRPSQAIAGILCAAIISDTLKFQSPTSTDLDRQVAERLADIAGIDIEDFAALMFKAGTSYKGKTPEEAFQQDFKKVTVGGYHVGISQITVLDSVLLNELKSGVIGYMREKSRDSEYALMVIIFTDLGEKRTELHFAGELAETVLKELEAPAGSSAMVYPYIMSRKKDVIPLIAMMIEKMRL